jgi:hypothetical protein
MPMLRHAEDTAGEDEPGSDLAGMLNLNWRVRLIHDDHLPRCQEQAGLKTAWCGDSEGHPGAREVVPE